MSDRRQLKPFQVITNGSMAGNIESSPTIIDNISLVTYTYTWSGTSPVGTLKIQVSNDYKIDASGAPANASTATWSDVSFLTGTANAASLALSGNTGSAVITSPLLGAYAIRTVFTRTSGTGTLQAIVCGKVA